MLISFYFFYVSRKQQLNSMLMLMLNQNKSKNICGHSDMLLMCHLVFITITFIGNDDAFC